MNPKTEILLIAGRARKAKAEGQDIVDGTIGMLMDDSGKLADLPAVTAQLREPLDLSYPPIAGDPAFTQGVFTWVFGKQAEKARLNNSVSVFGTLGGTGAVFMAMRFAGLERFEILGPGIGWPNYVTIAEANGLSYRPYGIFDGQGNFGFANIEKLVSRDAGKFRGFLIIVNDPCQNPTGYSLSPAEGQEIFDRLNAIADHYHTRIDVLFDVAYLDFAASRPTWIEKISRGESGAVRSLIAFSCSKNFGVYGMRLGALVALFPKDKEDKSLRFMDRLSEIARGSYSMPNGTGMRALAALMSPARCGDTKAEVGVLGGILRQRSTDLISALDANGLNYLPYREGFFITLKVAQPAVDITQALEKRNIFLVPIGPNMIRISLASLRSGQEKRLAAGLAAVVNGYMTGRK